MEQHIQGVRVPMYLGVQCTRVRIEGVRAPRAVAAHLADCNGGSAQMLAETEVWMLHDWMSVGARGRCIVASEAAPILVRL